jgi:selenide,water dikinase
VKPAEGLLDAWPEWEAGVRDGAVRSIAVIGGGAGGVEILLAMQHRLATHGLAASFSLVSDRWSLPSALERLLVRVLRAKEVRLAIGSAVTSVRGEVITLESGETLRADRMLAATGASALPWLRASGLACDTAGFVQVDATLRSVSHPFVHASGDCATIVGGPRPKAGVFPVRQAPCLAHNLSAAIEGTPLRSYRPQRDWLAIVTTGPRHAIATRNGFAIGGAWVWRWKDRIDRAFVARYRAPTSDAPRTGG